MTVPQQAGTATTSEQAGSKAGSEAGPVRVFEQHVWYTRDHGVPHPVAATYLDRPGLLAAAERARHGSRITLLDPAADEVAGRMWLPGLTKPVTLADNGRGRLAALVGDRFLTWPDSARGAVHPRSRDVGGVRLGRPAGMTYDPVSRTWLVLDTAGHRLVRLVVRGERVRAVNGPTLGFLGNRRLQGVAVDSASGRVYVAAPAADRLYALTRNGVRRQTLDLTDVGDTSLRTLAFGATTDPTDSAGVTNLYATDAGRVATTFGKVSEVSLTPLGTAAAAAPQTSTASLVRETLLSELSPPAPDPAGIVYMSDRDRLLVADSEVDEMAIYQNANLWQLSRADAAVLDAGNTLKFSREPTGIGYDPERTRVFVSDDDKEKIFEATTGPDNRYGTADDSVRSFSTTAVGAVDAEDVAYNTDDHALYIADGTGLEVIRVDPGSNGRFDGPAPSGGDDLVTNFDVGAYGIVDLEGIAYSPTRDSLFLADRKYTSILEVTTSGALVQSIDVSAIEMKNPAAITLGPASDDPTKTSMYVVTRGVDNNNHPDENDGIMYELSAPGIGPIGQDPNQAPSVDAGPDDTVALPADAILAGTVTDDKLPNPPGFTTTTWTKVSGPGTVSFADQGRPTTTASFSTAGTYVLRLSATDSALTTADDVTITAESTTVNTAPTVAAGPDQVVNLPASADLDGLATDDGLPNPPAATTLTWSKVSGPGAVSFTDPDAASTLASFGEPGEYVLRLTAFDSSLSASDELTVSANPAPPTGNLVGNPGFELGTSGWKGSTGVTLTRVQPGHSGDWAAKLTNTNTSAGTCQLNDSPDTVSTTVPGNYLATAWVKGDADSAGTTARLRIREWAGQILVGRQESALTLTTGWQQIQLNYLPAEPGASHLDVNLLRTTPPGATCLLVDDISVMTN